MSDTNDTPIANHEYDGIHELDNPLPMWWLVTFFGTIIFGFLYWIHFEFSDGKTLKQELEHDLAAVEKLRVSAPQANETEQLYAGFLSDPAMLELGASVYTGKCAACHGPELQGLIGPNLVDPYWVHGKGHANEIAEVVRKGVLDKGMPNWDAQLSQKEIQAVVTFVVSRYGSNPPNPKEPQGEKFERN